MRPIYHLAPEFAPLAKVGGMGDAIYGFVKEQSRIGMPVAVVMPAYASITLSGEIIEFSETLTVCKTSFESIPIYLIQEPRYFDRESIYRQPDDTERFLYFSSASVELINILEKQDCVVHCHDWHTAAACVKLGDAQTLLTIHNLKYRGLGDKALLKKFEYSEEPFLLDDGKVCLLQGGLLTANELVAVSPTYAKEILSPPLDCGFSHILKKRKKHLHGILNGLDNIFWNPEHDAFIDRTYSNDTYESAKRENRKLLQKEYGLREPHGPLYAVITRFDPQKGPEMIAHAIEKVEKLGGQLMFIGNSTNSDCDRLLKKIKNRYSISQDVAIVEGFNEKLAHRLYASADFILVPSVFEPCGLTQLIGMRYGTLPIVRATGGLADTVTDSVNGFVFEKASNEQFSIAIEKSFLIFGSAKHKEMVAHAMSADTSWAAPAKKYAALYAN